MLRFLWKNGGKKTGFTQRTRVVGFSGTAVTITAEDYRMRIKDRLSVGKPSGGTPERSEKTARRKCIPVEQDKDRLCCTGHMTAEKYKIDPEHTKDQE